MWASLRASIALSRGNPISTNVVMLASVGSGAGIPKDIKKKNFFLKSESRVCMPYDYAISNITFG